MTWQIQIGQILTHDEIEEFGLRYTGDIFGGGYIYANDRTGQRYLLDPHGDDLVVGFKYSFLR